MAWWNQAMAMFGEDKLAREAAGKYFGEAMTKAAPTLGMGAGAGAVYGLMSDDTGVIGGAFKGAALFGAGKWGLNAWKGSGTSQLSETLTKTQRSNALLKRGLGKEPTNSTSAFGTAGASLKPGKVEGASRNLTEDNPWASLAGMSSPWFPGVGSKSAWPRAKNVSFFSKIRRAASKKVAEASLLLSSPFRSPGLNMARMNAPVAGIRQTIPYIQQPRTRAISETNKIIKGVQNSSPIGRGRQIAMDQKLRKIQSRFKWDQRGPIERKSPLAYDPDDFEFFTRNY